MATETNEPELKLAATGTTKRCTVQLKEFVLEVEKYCHRDKDELDGDELTPLKESLILEGGIKVPVVFFTNAQGRKVVISGHRRITACRKLAADHKAGFSDDMQIEAIEVVGAAAVDIAIASVSENETRKNLRPIPKLRAIKFLDDSGADAQRAARALGLTSKQFESDLKLVKCSWLFQHVLDDNIAPNVAGRLLKLAAEKDRAEEFREELDEWVAKTKKAIRDKKKQAKAQGEKLKESELVVKKKMESELIVHWESCLKEGDPLDSDMEWEPPASLGEDGRLVISLDIDLNKASSERQAKVAGRLLALGKSVLPFVKEREQVEERQEKGKGKAQDFYDIKAMREAGLEAMANRLEELQQKLKEETSDGIDEPAEETAEQETTNLAETIALPEKPADGAPPPPEVSEVAEDSPAQEAPVAPAEEKKGKGTKAKKSTEDKV